MCVCVCLDGGVCEGGDEEERAAGAGCDWLAVDVSDERCGMEQEGGASHRASTQTPQGRSHTTDHNTTQNSIVLIISL